MNKRTQKTVVVKKRVLIVDDHPALRAGLRCYIELQPDWLVCGEAASAAEALTAVEQQHPDLAVIDLSLKDSHGLDLIKNLHVLHPDLLLLAFSMHPERDYAERILRAGGHGYLDKSYGPQHFLDAVRRILAGELYFSPSLNQQLLQQTRTAGARLDHQPNPTLSDRELQVFELVGHGLNTKEIADCLRINHKTVEEYRRRIRSKLNLPDGQAVNRRAFLASHDPQPDGQEIPTGSLFQTVSATIASLLFLVALPCEATVPL